MDTLAEIQERHDAVRELERKLLELQQVSLTSEIEFKTLYMYLGREC